MKDNGFNKYIDIEEIEVVDFDEYLYETEVDNMKKRVIEKMQDMSVSRKRTGIKVAAAAAVCAILIPSGVYAANKWNLFGNIFGGADESSVVDYVEYATEDTNAASDKRYVDSNDIYEVTADYCMYNQESGAGVLQFTLTNKTGDGRQWYEKAEIDEYYDDWEIGARDIPEIYQGEKNGYLSFQVEGLGTEDNRVYLKESESDANKKVCIIVFNDFERADFSAADLKLVVKERQYGNLNPILSVDIPKGESVPSLKWLDENGNAKAMLSGFDYFVSGIEDGGQDVSVKLKDGSEYHIQNEEKKIINELYGTLSGEGIWGSFCTILDLNEIEAFCFDGVEYHISDAVITN